MTETASDKVDYQRIIHASPKLSDSSKKQYIYNIGLIERKWGKSVDHCLQYPDQCVQYINSTYKELQTRKAFINALATLFKHDEGVRNVYEESMDAWYNYAVKANDAVSSRYEQGYATKRQEEVYVPWEEVLRKLDELGEAEYAGNRHLLLAMFVLEEPKRQDYGSLKIYFEDKGVPDKNELSNYIILRKKKNAVLILSDYKTAKTYGTLKLELRSELTKIIVTSLIRRPREYLFVNKWGRPFNDETFTKYTNKVFEGIFGKHVTVTTLRHSIIRYFLGRGITHADKTILSRRMCHGVAMQSAYQFKMWAENNKKCKLLCE